MIRSLSEKKRHCNHTTNKKPTLMWAFVFYVNRNIDLMSRHTKEKRKKQKLKKEAEVKEEQLVFDIFSLL